MAAVAALLAFDWFVLVFDPCITPANPLVFTECRPGFTRGDVILRSAMLAACMFVFGLTTGARSTSRPMALAAVSGAAGYLAVHFLYFALNVVFAQRLGIPPAFFNFLIFAGVVLTILVALFAMLGARLAVDIRKPVDDYRG